MIYVAPLSRLRETVERSRARHILSLIDAGTPIERPHSVPAENHVRLDFNDIVEPMDGKVMPSAEHVEAILDFGTRWDRAAPLVVHCWAGISRSTATAFILSCALMPHRSEVEIAQALRRASPSATPNRLLVAFADDRLKRGGRMTTAVEAIGRGATAFEGRPFSLELD